ncbi:hypothetical protein AYI68_g2337 [Smittium mucronatum]|uniref:Uncharacterized protein n=1 Tax=Smittium mucronatum TaxID=133383 RepID=A0A1R0H321_9FUNG|nr:hypothetical protein AYI68_g2337 [Smittium mucronatum]
MRVLIITFFIAAYTVFATPVDGERLDDAGIAELKEFSLIGETSQSTSSHISTTHSTNSTTSTTESQSSTSSQSDIDVDLEGATITINVNGGSPSTVISSLVPPTILSRAISTDLLPANSSTVSSSITLTEETASSSNGTASSELHNSTDSSSLSSTTSTSSETKPSSVSMPKINVKALADNNPQNVNEIIEDFNRYFQNNNNQILDTTENVAQNANSTNTTAKYSDIIGNRTVSDMNNRVPFTLRDRVWDLDANSPQSFLDSLSYRPQNTFGSRFEYLYDFLPEFRNEWNTNSFFRDGWDNDAAFRLDWYQQANEVLF